MSELKEQAPFKKRWALTPREQAADFLTFATVTSGMLLGVFAACWADGELPVVIQRMCIAIVASPLIDVALLLGFFLRRVPAD